MAPPGPARSASSGSALATAVAAGEEGDEDAEEGDDAVNDGGEDVANAGDDGHDGVSDGAEEALDLERGRCVREDDRW
jgi:hypothetical protein